MTESKIRVLAFSFGATAVWIYLVYLVSISPELRWWQIVILIMIGLFLSIMAMGQ